MKTKWGLVEKSLRTTQLMRLSVRKKMQTSSEILSAARTD